MAGKGANAAAEATRAALQLSLSASHSSGFSGAVSLKIGNPILAGVLGAGTLLGAFYLANKSLVEKAIRNSLEGRHETGITDPEVRSIKPGSIIVELYCLTDRSLLKFVEDYEAKKVKHRLEEEFTKIGFNEELNLTIRNDEEVYKKVQEIR